MNKFFFVTILFLFVSSISACSYTRESLNKAMLDCERNILVLDQQNNTYRECVRKQQQLLQEMQENGIKNTFLQEIIMKKIVFFNRKISSNEQEAYGHVQRQATLSDLYASAPKEDR